MRQALLLNDSLVESPNPVTFNLCQYIRKIRCTSFVVSLFIPPLFAALFGSYSSIIYIIAGLYGIIFNIYACNNFRLLFNLKKEVDYHSRLNDEFKMERQEIDLAIKQLSIANNSLDETHQSLAINNLKMVDIIGRFHKLEQELTSINGQSQEQLSSLITKACDTKTKFYDILLHQQRQILWKIFDRLEASNDKGITKQDYETFYQLLPKEYQDRFDRLGGFQTILKVCATKSNIDCDENYIDAQDFVHVLDVYAQMHVENVDITFKIEKKRSNKISIDGMEELDFIRKVTILDKKRIE